MNLLSQFAAWAKKTQPAIDMTSEWSCCGTPHLAPVETELGRIESSDLWMSTCGHCGARWLNVVSLANDTSRWQPITRNDVHALLAATPGPERDALLKTWLRERS
jgi:hypothetical protein